MKRVTGIGGIFFKAKDAPALQAWYKRHLGIDVQEWGGAAFDWVDSDGKPTGGTTAWLVAPEESEQFAPSKAWFMVNYRVEDLQALVAALKARLSGADLLAGALTLDHAMDACAQIVNALHRSNIALGRRRTLDDDLTGLRNDIREVQRISPELGAQFQTWLERIESYAEESDALLPRFCHGDYTYAQVIFDGRQSELVDFDTVCQAEPALDLGQFLAYLRAAAHKAGKAASSGATPIAVQLGEHFLDAYIAAAGDQIEDVERLRIRVSVYEVVSLMRMALHSWQQLKATRLENAIAVLEEAMVRLPQLDY